MNARKSLDGTALVAAPSANAKEDRHFVTALARGLEVLSCFRSGDLQLGNQEIAQRCNLPKSTVSRLTYTLTKIGCLHRIKESSKYRLGTTTSPDFGNVILALLKVRRMALQHMQELADFSRGTVALGMRDKHSMIFIENCRSESAPIRDLDTDAGIPLVTTAMGRAYLAILPEVERRDLLLKLRDLDEETRCGIYAGIEQGLQQYREIGCCCSFGEEQKDVNAIAVAFQPDGGLPAMTLCCSGPASSMEPQFLLDEIRPKLIDLARSIESSVAERG